MIFKFLRLGGNESLRIGTASKMIWALVEIERQWLDQSPSIQVRALVCSCRPIAVNALQLVCSSWASDQGGRIVNEIFCTLLTYAMVTNLLPQYTFQRACCNQEKPTTQNHRIWTPLHVERRHSTLVLVLILDISNKTITIFKYFHQWRTLTFVI